MDRIVECVPNFSEGKDRNTIDAIAAAVRAVAGVKLLNVDPDADYNRVVVTFAGEPEATVEAAFAAARVAVERIDMTAHHGEHPRMGAMDVCPFVPVKGVTMADCVQLSRTFGRRLAQELDVPVYLYAEAAARPSRVRLPDIRKGEYEGLAEKLRDPDWAPDFGLPRFNPRSGATVTGARFFLLAFNINLESTDVKLANTIAGMVRESGYPLTDEKGEKVLDDRGQPVRVPGLLKAMQAMGVELASHGIAQVSSNLLNYPVTPLHLAYEQVKKLAAQKGVVTRGSELVGLVPLDALLLSGRFYLKEQGVDPESVTEAELVQAAVDGLGLSSLAPFDPHARVIEYLL